MLHHDLAMPTARTGTHSKVLTLVLRSPGQYDRKYAHTWPCRTHVMTSIITRYNTMAYHNFLCRFLDLKNIKRLRSPSLKHTYANCGIDHRCRQVDVRTYIEYNLSYVSVYEICVGVTLKMKCDL